MPKKPWYNCISNAGTADKTQHINAEPAQSSSDDEDYDSEADEVDSWDDYVDDLYAEEEAVPRNKSNGRKDTDYWNVVAARLLSGFLGSLGADFQHFPINEDSWKTIDNALKEHAYDTIKVYDEEESFEENAKRKPSGIDAQQWRWFLNYRLKESTKKKCRQNAPNRLKQLYTHTGGSKTTARLRDEEEKKQQRRISRGEMFIMTHKKRDGSYMNDDARVVGREIIELKAVAAEQKAEITELKAAAAEQKAEAAEDKAKIQTMENLVKYIIQQQGHTLPPEIDVQLKSLGSGAK
ncbi:hypothetical protein Ahy_B05g075726 [Arachis hypogaea]|uniref:Uncharacterized protein n=1 Tax=Arachis hypogaea TaxID=3818 RepID=A0A444Z1X0_ARAHY|nr:hypothetical protein Ahy_B05g075726 [Arachis hypogaea]